MSIPKSYDIRTIDRKHLTRHRKFASQAELVKQMIEKVLSLCVVLNLIPAATIQDGCSAHRKLHVNHCTLQIPANTLPIAQDFKCGFVDRHTLLPVWVISDMPHTLVKKPRNGWLKSRKKDGSTRRWVRPYNAVCRPNIDRSIP